MLLRMARADEAALLTEISRAAFHTDFLVGGEPNEGPPDYDSAAWHEQMQKEGHLYAYTDDDNTTVGGAVLFDGGRKVYVGRIFIAPEYHRKGYGYSLMLDIEKQFPRAAVFALDTPAVNVRTNALYRKLGYAEVGRDKESVSYEKVVTESLTAN